MSTRALLMQASSSTWSRVTLLKKLWRKKYVVDAVPQVCMVPPLSTQRGAKIHIERCCRAQASSQYERVLLFASSHLPCRQSLQSWASTFYQRTKRRDRHVPPTLSVSSNHASRSSCVFLSSACLEIVTSKDPKMKEVQMTQISREKM